MKILRMLKRVWKYLLVTIFGALILWFLFNKLAGETDSPTAFIAIASILLVIVTATSIIQSAEIEKGDRKERKLQEIKDWALKAAEYATTRESIKEKELERTRSKYELSLSAKAYITEVAKELFPDLYRPINNVVNKLEKSIDAIIDFESGTITPSKFVQSESELRKSIEYLLRAIANVNY